MHFILLLFFPLYLLSQTFSVASYNLYNLFDAVEDGTEYDDFKYPHWNEAKYRTKLNDMAFVIRDIDADIIALQEIENERTLLDLKALLPKYKYYAIDTKKGAPISVALLSKFPIKKTQKVVVNSSRDILKSVVVIGKSPLAIYVNHWQSLRSPERSRIRYAQALMQAIEKSNYKEYILIGDFNSNYDRYLYHEAPVAINHTLKTVENMVLNTKENLNKGSHYNLWLELPHNQRYSYIFRGRPNTLDHIILPQTLFDGKGIDYINNSFEVIRKDYLYTNSNINKRYSDHLPIIAKFSTKPFKPLPQPSIETISIEQIYKDGGVNTPKIVQNATLIYRDKYGAIIKDNSRAIYIYAPDITLEIGKSYDLIIKESKIYRGMVEVSQVRVLKEDSGTLKGKFLNPKGLDLNDERYFNEVIESIEGKYENGKFIYDGGTINIYFQDRAKKPSQSTNIKLQNVRLSKFRGNMQITVSHASKVTR